MISSPSYPVSFSADYPEQQSRWKAALRLPLAIPVFLYYSVLSYALYGALWFLWLVILIRGRIPRWLFNYMAAVSRGMARATGYFNLLTDAYPPFEGPHPVQLEIQYPERISRRRLLFWKLITAVPHFLVLQVLQAAALAVLPIAWVAIIFTGRFPKGLHTFVTGVIRWQQRVNAYVLSLTDAFPPYSLAPDAGAGSRRALVLSALLGLAAVAGIAGGITAIVIYIAGHDEQVIPVSYQRLTSGNLRPGETFVAGKSLAVSLNRARDPEDVLSPFLQAGAGKRLIAFEMTIQDVEDESFWIDEYDFRLDDSLGRRHRPFLILANNRPAPLKLAGRERASVQVIFEIDASARPAGLRYHEPGRFLKTLVYKFE